MSRVCQTCRGINVSILLYFCHCKKLQPIGRLGHPLQPGQTHTIVAWGGCWWKGVVCGETSVLLDTSSFGEARWNVFFVLSLLSFAFWCTFTLVVPAHRSCCCDSGPGSVTKRFLVSGYVLYILVVVQKKVWLGTLLKLRVIVTVRSTRVSNKGRTTWYGNIWMNTEVTFVL